MKKTTFTNTDVQDTFDTYTKKMRGRLLALREHIFKIANATDNVGSIEETLKWECPSYLTHKPKSGTTIRLSPVRSNSDEYAMSVHCQTTLISDFKEIYPELKYDTNRSIIFNVNDELPLEPAKEFIHMALTYHQRKKSS